jgi:sugar lactone lactonase YvrE
MVVGRTLSLGFKFLIAGVMCCAWTLASAQLKVSTVAGGFEGNGGPAVSAGLTAPGAVAVDKKGRLYIGENFNCQIRRVNEDGTIKEFAGQKECGFSGDGGPASVATFSGITGMAFDRKGNLLVTDSANWRIRKIDSNGIVTTVAGNGTFGNTGDGGLATQASIGFVEGITTDSQNRVYFSDTNNVVRMVNSAGIINTVAGNGTSGFSGDGGLATSAQLSEPMGLLIDGNGNLYIADDLNGRVREVSPNGTITTIAGNGQGFVSQSGGPATSVSVNGPQGLALQGSTLYISTFSNAIWALDLVAQQINIIGGENGLGGFSGDGSPAISTLFSQPNGIVFDSAGNLIVADSGNDRVREISTAQIVSTIAGGHVGDDGPAKDGSLNGGVDVHLAFDAVGNLYVADPGNNRVRKVTPDGTITTFAGVGISGYSGDGGLATNAMLSNPNSVTVDNQGNVFIADVGNGVIRKVNPTGVISSFARPSPFGFLSTVTIGMTTDASGNLYSTDGLSLVYKTDPSGNSTIFAGVQFQTFYNGDGIPATQAALNFPAGLAFDRNGNLYIAEWIGNRIRKVDINGIISTVVGNGIPGFSGDGGLATNAELDLPFDVGVDSQGNIYIADFVNSRIRVVDGSGMIQTIAGNGNIGFNGNHLAATSANIAPTGIAIKPNGTVFFTDEDRSLVRKVH